MILNESDIAVAYNMEITNFVMPATQHILKKIEYQVFDMLSTDLWKKYLQMFNLIINSIPAYKLSELQTLLPA